MSDAPETSGGYQPGMLVAGRYRLDRLLGRGGMGEVWAVTHAVTQRALALKLLHGPVRARPDRRRRFLREARAASAINHPNVVQIQDFFELEDGTPVMLMDLLEGETLGARLARERTLPLQEAVDALLPVVSAVGTAHSLGIVHRDLKPDNVFLARGKEGALDVRVLDFGIAKLTAAWGTKEEAASATDTDAMLGTPHYMSPEQCFDQAEVDHRTDVWALGVMLYEALTGAKPIDGENVGRVLSNLMNEAITPIEVLAPDVAPDVARLVMRMLARDKAERPADLREVHDALSPHGSVSVPQFDAATRERPPPLDSSPSSQSAPRPPPPALDDTEPGLPPSSAGSFPAPVEAAPPRAAPSRAVLVGAGLVAALGVGLWFLRGPAPPAPSRLLPASSAPSVPPVAPPSVPEAERPREEAPVASPASSASGSDLRRKAAPSPRPSASVGTVPPPSSAFPPPPRPSSGSTGLVEEPPF